MGKTDESGQVLVGAVFLLMACTLFLFSVHDIALLWRDRAKVQQTVDVAALSTGSVIADVLTLMELYNIISIRGLVRFPQLIAVGEAIDVLRVGLETYEIFGSIAGMVGSDTLYPMTMISKPRLDAYFDEVVCRFVFTTIKEPGRRVFTIGGTAGTLSDRFLFNKYTNRHLGSHGGVVVTAEVGIFKFRKWGITYVPVLLD